MKYSYQITYALLVIVLAGCQNSHTVKKITNLKDYGHHLDELKTQDETIEENRGEVEFWLNKIEARPNGFTYYRKAAEALRKNFDLQPDPQDLIRADELLERARGFSPPGERIHLAYQQVTNAIGRHDFQLAKQYSLRAIEFDPLKQESSLMLFDALMELGEYGEAGELIKRYKAKNTFDFMVRYAKFQDYEGNLDSAIVTMQRASEIAKDSGNQSIYAWSLANLGDMYGHAGEIKRSYDFYLEALQNDPGLTHALAGIAWITYSHEKDAGAAKRIISRLLETRNEPDLHLFLAEIAEFEGNHTEKNAHIDSFLKKVNQLRETRMYHKYIALLESEEKTNYDWALELSFSEIRNRPTPQSYDLLAWTYYQKGEISEAVEIASRYVENKTFEPEAIYHLGMIHMAAGNEIRGRRYLEEALSSAFELGPVKVRLIEEII